jgi:hypothetical protein
MVTDAISALTLSNVDLLVQKQHTMKNWGYIKQTLWLAELYRNQNLCVTESVVGKLLYLKLDSQMTMKIALLMFAALKKC